LINMRTSICLVRLALCLVALIERSDAKKKPSKGKGKGKGKPSKGNGGNGEQPTEETAPVVEKCKSEPSPPRDLSSDQGLEMMRLSMEKATELKTPVTICIRDRHDNLVAHIRMKNAILGSVDLACQKARSSALFPAPSGDFAAFPGIELSNGIISNLQGGLPLITSDGVHVGSIGVSGAAAAEIDVEIAKVAADMIDSLLAESCYLEKWTATGEVPTKLAMAPPAPLYMSYNNKNVLPNDLITSEEMLEKPTLTWDTESGALYTIFIIDFGIERLEGLQWVHWLVTNVKDGASVDQGDEVKDYVPPFYFKIKEDFSGLDLTKGTRGHDILALVYKQKTGQVDMVDERQVGCNEGLGDGSRIDDHFAIAEKYNLELVAGNFFFSTYTDATNDLLCYFTKCTGEPFPIPAEGINDGAECQ